MAGIVAQSRTSAWALGGGFTLAQPQSDFPAALHWNGHSWSKVTSFPKAIGPTGIGCAGESSPANVWAFAGTTNSGSNAAAAGALRLEGGRWKLVKRFPAGIVTNCLVEAPTEVWVFGDSHVAPGVGTWHLHGRAWTQVITGNYAVDSASAVSSGDVWAQGETGFGVPVLAHWNGRTWVRNSQLSRALPKVSPKAYLFLGGITATGRHDVWFRLYVISGPPANPAISARVLHWNGRAWFKVGTRDFGYYLPGAVPDGHGGWWAEVAVTGFGRRVFHEVRGRWWPVPVLMPGCRTGPLTQLTPVPGTTSVLGLQQCPAKHPPGIVNVLLYGPRL
jgi:hypothetical protein